MPLRNPSAAAGTGFISWQAMISGTSAIHASHPRSGSGSEQVSKTADNKARAVLAVDRTMIDRRAGDTPTSAAAPISGIVVSVFVTPDFLGAPLSDDAALGPVTGELPDREAPVTVAA